MKQFKFADIFAGCGGFTVGFAANPAFQPCFAVDHWDTALRTLKHNIPEVTCLAADLSEDADLERIGKLLTGVDVMLGGPPCQGFSTLGKRRDGDTRSTLVDVFADLVLAVRPALVVVENVRGITTKQHPHFATYADALISRLSADPSCPYVCSARTLNAVEYNVPQNRVRWFMFAVRADLVSDDYRSDLIWDAVSSLKNGTRRTVAETIADLPTIAAGEAASTTADGRPLFNHQAMRHSRDLIQRLECIPSNGGLPDVPREYLTPHLRKMLDGEYGSGGHVKNIYGRLNWAEPSGTIVAGIDKITCGRFVHPEQNRLISPRECARLQSFADSYEFLGGQVAQYYQIGNAVPPGMSSVLADAAALVLKKLGVRPKDEAPIHCDELAA